MPFHWFRLDAPRRSARLALPLLAALVVASTAVADVVHLKSGQKVEGKIIAETGDTIEVQTKFGSMKLDRANVTRIERMRLPKEELAKRVEDAGDDAVLLWQAVEYARENKLKAEIRPLLEKIVEVDPGHVDANKELGNIYFEGKWYSPEALEAEKAAHAERMKADGKVFYQGKWLKEDTVKRLEGYELYRGEWLKWKDIYLLEAEENMPAMLGESLPARASDHYILWSQLDESFQADVLTMLETGFRHFVATFQPNDVQLNMMTFYPTAVYVLPTSAMVETFAADDGYMVKLYNPPKDINERYLDATSFPIFFPRPLIVTSAGRHLRGGGSKNVSLMGFLSHFAGNVMVRRYKQGGKIPGWVEAGVTHYYEGALNGYQTLTCDEYVGFEHVQVWADGLETFPAWYKQMADPAFRASLPRLRDFKGKMVEELAARELVKSYFMVKWLMDSDPARLIEYLNRAYADPQRIRITIPEEQAFQEAFGVAPEALEEEFERWASSLTGEVPVEH